MEKLIAVGILWKKSDGEVSIPGSNKEWQQKTEVKTIKDYNGRRTPAKTPRESKVKKEIRSLDISLRTSLNVIFTTV